MREYASLPSCKDQAYDCTSNATLKGLLISVTLLTVVYVVVFVSLLRHAARYLRTVPYRDYRMANQMVRTQVGVACVLAILCLLASFCRQVCVSLVEK